MVLTAEHLKSVLRRFHNRLELHREALNRLNVYPVPDGDTGTNMALTVGSVMAEVEDASSMDEVAAAMAHGSLMGARGNSGIILSEILRGLADRFAGCELLGTEEIGDALTMASEAAYQAVLRPVEGTILTVVREAAGAEAVTGGDVAAFLDRVYHRGLEALEGTPDLLPVLAEAGVVDAGGAGLVLLLAAFVEEVTDAEVELPMAIYDAPGPAVRLESNAVPDIADLRYEVMFLLDASADAIEEFRTQWAEIGDSIVVVGGGGIYNCHIHTDEIGGAIEAGIRAGRPHRIEITDLAGQAADLAHHPREFIPIDGINEADVGVIAVATGSGVIERFRLLGVQAVVAGGQSMNPSTLDLLAAVEAAPNDSIVVLPNNKNIITVADQLDSLTGKAVMVVPTRSVQAGFAAMMGYLPTGDLDPVATAMFGNSEAVATGELTMAVRTTNAEGLEVSEGDWLGLVDGKIVVVHPDQSLAVVSLLDTFFPTAAELLTVITGEDAQTQAVVDVESWVATRGQGLAVEFVEGGQPLYPFLLAAE